MDWWQWIVASVAYVWIGVGWAVFADRIRGREWWISGPWAHGYWGDNPPNPAERGPLAAFNALAWPLSVGVFLAAWAFTMALVLPVVGTVKALCAAARGLGALVRTVNGPRP